jgi:hypothetical protein
VLGVLGFFLVATTIFLFIRKRRQVIQQPDKDDVPGFWGKISRYFKPRGNYVAAAGEDGNNQSHQLDSAPSRRNRDVEQANPTRTSQASAAVNRNTSVRSVLTLPAYSHSASHNERVLGREGDRDGMDVVVDLPTMEDEEELREQEMGALYQLRLARRQQNEEREEVRRQRREAQRRGDTRELAEIRSRDRAASNSHNSLVEDLRRDIERAKENRQRSVSSVSYADLGVARHDGTRIRANSQESERMGLLSDAADIAALSIRSGANSPALHGRHRSGSSVGSFDSDFPSPGLTRTRPASQAATSSGLSVGRGRAGSSPEIVESDLGVEPIPPPDYEDVPLDDDNDVRGRSTTPINEPPPGYSGPVRRLSERDPDTTTEGLASAAIPPESTSEDGASTPRGRGVGGTPQLPSLRISRLPEIVIEPSSARPRETTDQ